MLFVIREIQNFAFTNIPIINKQKHQESVRTWTTWNTDTLLNTTANTSGTTQRLKLPHDPGVLLLGNYPTIEKKRHKFSYKNVHSNILHSSQKRCEQFKCPVIEKWIHKMQHAHTAEYSTLRMHVPYSDICYNVKNPEHFELILMYLA